MKTAELDPARLLEKTTHLFADAAKVRPMSIATVEGMNNDGHLVARKMFVGENLLFLQVWRKKGLIDPWHQHDDHESIGYLISGKMKVIVGETEMICGPGCSWIHPIGVPHYSEALEDCLQIEVKSPPRKNWTESDA